jgi:hypothetical protein
VGPCCRVQGRDGDEARCDVEPEDGALENAQRGFGLVVRDWDAEGAWLAWFLATEGWEVEREVGGQSLSDRGRRTNKRQRTLVAGLKDARVGEGAVLAHLSADVVDVGLHVGVASVREGGAAGILDGEGESFSANPWVVSEYIGQLPWLSETSWWSYNSQLAR